MTGSPLGIMQGRLVPREDERYQGFPWRGWRDEFTHAAADGFDAIEFIFEQGRDTHPLLAPEGLAEIEALAAASGVAVRTVCADEFLVQPLHADDDAARSAAWQLLDALIASVQRLGVTHITVPCLDGSSMPNQAAIDRLVKGLRTRTGALEQAGIQLCLETDLPATRLRRLLDGVGHEAVGVTYDMGNCASLGFRASDDLEAYGDRIGVVHIKDRPVGQSSVPLGEGAVDFEAVIRGLTAKGYEGPWILQAARDDGDADRAVARHQADYFSECLQRWST